MCWCASQKQEDALAMSAELGRLLDPAPEGVKVLGPAEAPVPKLKSEFRYQLSAQDRRSQAVERNPNRDSPFRGRREVESHIARH